MGKTRDLFMKIRDTKTTFHAKLGKIKDRNGMDLTEAEEIKKRWQEHTEEIHSNILAWKIPWMEEPGRLQSMRSQRVRHD